MSKNYGFLLLISVYICSYRLVDGGLTVDTFKKSNKSIILEEIIISLLECDLGIKNMLVWDFSLNSTIYKGFSNLQPPITILSTLNLPFRRLQNFTYQGFILIMSTRFSVKTFQILVRNFLCEQDCILLVTLYNPYSECIQRINILKLIKLFYFTKVYFICFDQNIPYVFTHDIYGNTHPPYWTIFLETQWHGNNWTIYSRVYHKDGICHGLDFQRVSYTDSNVLVGLNVLKDGIDLYNASYKISGDEIMPFVLLTQRENIQTIKKLMKIPFKYVVFSASRDLKVYTQYMHELGGADILIFLQTRTNQPIWLYSYPMWYEFQSILSHNRGLRTPLEKIIHFYGLWTLISLIIIIITTFIVIFIKTRKNFSHASFDIIRLLINTEVYVPINTLSLRVYFGTIFVFFLVIHSTFSGNLSKFLTKYEYRKNVDSVVDLLDPRIQKVYSGGWFFTEENDNEIFRKNEGHLGDGKCMSKTEKDPNSACIAVRRAVMRFVLYKGFEKFYAGREKSYPTLYSNVYRERFPLQERYNWAQMVLTETDIYMHYTRQADTIMMYQYMKTEANLQVIFRAIKIEDFKFAFILLAVGNSLGILCFLAEKFIKWNPTIKLKWSNRPTKVVPKKLNIKITSK